MLVITRGYPLLSAPVFFQCSIQKQWTIGMIYETVNSLGMVHDWLYHMEVSQKRATPKSFIVLYNLYILIGCSIVSHLFWVSPFMETPILKWTQIYGPTEGSASPLYVAMSCTAMGRCLRETPQLWELKWTHLMGI